MDNISLDLFVNNIEQNIIDKKKYKINLQNIKKIKEIDVITKLYVDKHKIKLLIYNKQLLSFNKKIVMFSCTLLFDNNKGLFVNISKCIQYLSNLIDKLKFDKLSGQIYASSDEHKIQKKHFFGGTGTFVRDFIFYFI